MLHHHFRNVKCNVGCPIVADDLELRGAVRNSRGNGGCGTYTTAMLSTFDVAWIARVRLGLSVQTSPGKVG